MRNMSVNVGMATAETREIMSMAFGIEEVADPNHAMTVSASGVLLEVETRCVCTAGIPGEHTFIDCVHKFNLF